MVYENNKAASNGRTMDHVLDWFTHLIVRLGKGPKGDTLYDIILEETIAFYGADAGAILFCADDSGPGRVRSSRGLDKKEIQALSFVMDAFCGRTNEPVSIAVSNDNPPWNALSSAVPSMSQWIVVPLTFSSRFLGTLLLGLCGDTEFSPPPDSFSRLLGTEIARFVDFEHLSTALVESEERYRRIFIQSKDVFYETTTEGRFVDVNQAGVDLFGFESKEELLALESIALLYYNVEDRIRFRKQIEKDGFVKDYEVRFRTKGGTPIDVLITSNVRKRPNGRVLGYEGVIKDITTRKNLERQLAESEANYRMMVENSSDGIAIYDEEGFVFTNQAFLNLFNYFRTEDILHMDILQFLAPESLLPFLELVRSKKFPGRIPETFEGRGRRSDGSVFSMEVSAFPTQFAGREAIQITFRDVTQKREMEEQLIQDERLRAMGKLAFDIAHEINNPLGGIMTYSHLLLESQTGNRIERENLEKIIKLANRCKIIVRGLLDFARDEADQRELVDVNKVLQDTLFLLEGHVLFRKIQVVQKLDRELPAVFGVRSKMEQVFLNIILNAAEAMGGAGELAITTRSKQEDHWIQIVFKDTGPGVDEEHLRDLFQPFFTTKKRGRGTGLGLSISHGIIKQHGGRILVKSAPNEGCEFTIELPC